MKQGTLSGLVAAAFTPFGMDGELNLSQISKLAQLYRTNRLGGVFINGTTGEFASLSLTEQKLLVEAWQSDKGSLPVGVMLGGTCIKDMQELALFSAEKEMDAVAMLSPYYFRPKTVADLVEVVAEVASTVPHIPFYYYHIPSLTFSPIFTCRSVKAMYSLLSCFSCFTCTQKPLRKVSSLKW